jgi:hypothetical protein
MLLVAYLMKSIILLGFPVSWPSAMFMWLGGVAALYRLAALYFAYIDRWDVEKQDPRLSEPWLGFLLGVGIWYFPIARFPHYEWPFSAYVPSFILTDLADWTRLVDAFHFNPDLVVLAESVVLFLSLSLNQAMEKRERMESVFAMPKREERMFPEANEFPNEL